MNKENNDNANKEDFTQKNFSTGNNDQRLDAIKQRNLIDAKYGYKLHTDNNNRLGWLVNVQQSEVVDDTSKTIFSSLDLYFIEDDGNRFKISLQFRPYLFLGTTQGNESLVSSYLNRKHHSVEIDVTEKVDLDLKNHLSGIQSKFIRVSFPSTVEMQQFKKEYFSQINKNKESLAKTTDYSTLLAEHMGCHMDSIDVDPKEQIIDIREYDIPIETRVCIDCNIFVGVWYDVIGKDSVTNKPFVKRNEVIVEPPDPTVLAFDIETTKLPLKFPDAEFDQIMMISYMIDAKGFLIINREIVSQDIDDFEYTPKPEFQGEFTVYNEPNEKSLILRFFDHVLRVQPSIMVTYNGDFFDWPFIETRASFHHLNMSSHIGFFKDSQDEYKHNNSIHMDAFRWVQRDSYLPMGSQNLKAATKAKLSYDPVELNPEDMLKMAHENPKLLANYSVSDAVATYYLYMKYVHPFIFALCTIIPLCPDDVLRKGSGTLCEALLMVQAFRGNIIFPNKQINRDNKFSDNGHLIESETYVGARVEALESGVYRSDLKYKFRLDVDVLKRLKNEVSRTMQHSLEVEMKIDINRVIDFDSVCASIEEKLEFLTNNSLLNEYPCIYHLDVAAMYPNIILTNRLQPPAVVTEENCIACIYNTPDAKCKRPMNWMWRGEMIPALKGEYERLIQQLKQEKFGKPPIPFYKLSRDEKIKIEKKRINDFCRKAYGKVHITKEELRSTTICQRENAFYVDTVLAFRDRRYEYKTMHKKAKADLDLIPSYDLSGRKLAQSRVILYDSLQLAHKCILNSFYGYVMRKGSRWFSMEMAGIVCYTGVKIITEARQLVEKIGRPLELDTDGIWCLLPISFPGDFSFKMDNGKIISVSYPGALLNSLVQNKFTNDQYHSLDSDGNCKITHENSIFFEVDGPYHAMILPASKEEGKKLKKRYAVFNFDGSIAELKGFEIKRRGELTIIKQFQSSVFKSFLNGKTLEEAYSNVADEANYWLDILFDRAKNLPTRDLFELIAEDKSMSRKLEDYGSQKSTSITTAKRLAQFLGDSMVKDKGLACRYIVSKYPLDAAVTERTIPVAIFDSEQSTRNRFLKDWTKCHQINFNDENSIREIIDWTYYIDRLGSCVQKIITIPAAFQGVKNPVPRVPHPNWLENRKRQHEEYSLQPKITDVFKKNPLRIDNSIISSSSRKRSIIPLSYSTVENENDENIVNDRDILTLESYSNKPKKLMTNVSSKKRKTMPVKLRYLSPEFYDRNKFPKKSWSNDGFTIWFEYIKTKWRLQHSIREIVSSNNLSGARDFNMGVSTHSEFVLRSDSHVWHILQLLETKSQGQYTAFVVIDGTMRRFNLTVPKKIYVDDVKKRSTTVGTLVTKILPKTKLLGHLYEYSLDAAQFASRIVELSSELCLMRINGVYETKIPLMFKALTSVGSSCMLKRQRLNTEIQLDQISRISRFETEYLPFESVKLFYLYEFVQTQSARSVTALFIPSRLQGFITVVNRVEVDLENLNVLFKSELEKFINKKGDEILEQRYHSFHIVVHQCKSQRDAVRYLQSQFNSLKLSHMDPCLVCLQSNRLASDFVKDFTLFSEFPRVQLNFSDPIDAMNMLNWQNIISKRAIQHFFISFIYLKDYWMVANYLEIPIGNIPEDISAFGLDLFFARQLNLKNHLLWASPSIQPDFGSKELEDLRLENNWDTVSFHDNSGYVVNKEFFEAQNIIVEVSLGAVAVTALLQSSRIAEAEGTSELVGFVSDAPSMSIENALSHRTFGAGDDGIAVSGILRVLKEVFHELVRDIHVNKNVLADQLVMSMHRWVLSKNSLLYHPGIRDAIAILMRKICILLVSEINRLGGEVIFCSFNKLVMSTKKSTMPLAQTFVNSLITALAQKPVFASLQIFPRSYYNLLIWISPSNHASISSDIDGNGKFNIHFSLADRLPEEKGCRALFFKTIAGYMALMSKKLWISKDNSQKKSDDDEFNLYCEKLLMEEIAPNLFKVTTKLVEVRKHLNMCAQSRIVVGSPLYDVPLEFVNTICKILSVNQTISDNVEKIKNQLSLILQTNSSDAKTCDQSGLNIVLENIFCKKCSQIIDIDINKLPQKDQAHAPRIPCPNCNNSFSKSFVEEILVGRVSKMHLSFILQDWKCSECKKIGARYLSHACECNNSYENSVSVDDFLQNLNSLLCISKLYSLNNLEYFIEQIIS